MTLNEYQAAAAETAFGAAKETIIYPALGLAGETGEVVEKIKKLWRDKAVLMRNEVLPADAELLAPELGDVLWYLSMLATNFGLTLEEVAEGNIAKLKSRQERGVLQGEGDDR